MKDEIVFLIDDFVNKYQSWDGDIIDLTDADKDVLCYEWLRAYPSWMDDYLPCCITGTVSQLEFLDMLYAKGTDAVSIRLKDAIYLELETSLRDRVQDHFCEEHMESDQ
tara:strand:- start:429 stop:755 length:327 start_codon:yes stop_codon:yes gene_type:complete